MKKLTILDTDKSIFSVYNISEDEHPEAFIEELILEERVSGFGTIHWQIMDDLIIRNYTK